jgi:xanthine/uracil permease
MRDLIACAIVGTGLGTIITFGAEHGLPALVVGIVILSVGCCMTEVN